MEVADAGQNAPWDHRPGVLADVQVAALQVEVAVGQVRRQIPAADSSTRSPSV